MSGTHSLLLPFFQCFLYYSFFNQISFAFFPVFSILLYFHFLSIVYIVVNICYHHSSFIIIYLWLLWILSRVIICSRNLCFKCLQMHFAFEVECSIFQYQNSYSLSTSFSQNLSIKIYLSLDKSLSKMEKVGRKIKRKLKVEIWFKKNILNNKASCFLPRFLVYL